MLKYFLGMKTIYLRQQSYGCERLNEFCARKNVSFLSLFIECIHNFHSRLKMCKLEITAG